MLYENLKKTLLHAFDALRDQNTRYRERLISDFGEVLEIHWHATRHGGLTV